MIFLKQKPWVRPEVKPGVKPEGIIQKIVTRFGLNTDEAAKYVEETLDLQKI